MSRPSPARAVRAAPSVPYHGCFPPSTPAGCVCTAPCCILLQLPASRAFGEKEEVAGGLLCSMPAPRAAFLGFRSRELSPVQAGMFSDVL